MKRARKKFQVGDRSASKQTHNENNLSKIDINEEEKKQLELKYFGKEMEENETEVKKNITPENNAEENIDSQNIASGDNQESTVPVENTSVEDENDPEEDDDVKVYVKSSDTPKETAPEENADDNAVSEEKTDENSSDTTEDSSSASEENINSDEDIIDDNDNTKRKKKFRFQKKYAIIFTISLVVILVASVLAVSMGGLFDNSSFVDKDADEYTEPVDELSGKVNVLILGVDNEGLRTDTMIVASFDTDDNTLNMLSIPRDTRMHIGKNYQKINAAHAITQKNGKIAGPKGSIEAVTRLTGIPINHYVEFSFSAFRETIDALGGIYYNVPQNMKYKDPTQNLNINLKQGYQLLDGDKAEQLVRFRSYPEGDIKRVHVQQDFIKSVFDQKLNAGIVTKIPELYKTLSKNIKTSLTLSDLTKYANELLKLDMSKLVMYELPGNYSGSEYKASYWLPDMDEIKFLTETVFGYDTKYVTNGKPIKDAEYGKLSTTTATARPAKTSQAPSYHEDDDDNDDDNKKTSKPSYSEKPEKTKKPSQKPSQKPSSKTDKDDKKDKKDNDKKENKESPKPSQSPAGSSDTKPQKSTKPQQNNDVPSLGSSSDNPPKAESGGFELHDVHTPPPQMHKPQKTPDSVKTPAPATQKPQKTLPPLDKSEDFQRPGAN